jgi:cob(I)alamin adenosyltransferase
MSQFFTRNGDDGSTGLLGKGRVPKDHPRLEAVGALDEANAAIGVARAFCKSLRIKSLLLTIQRDLYNLMAEVAATPDNAAQFRSITGDNVTWLEEQAESLSASIEPPSEFIVPGDTASGAFLDLARTVVRRTERRVIHLQQRDELANKALAQYLNRLSSLLFFLELFENQLNGNTSPTLAKE